MACFRFHSIFTKSTYSKNNENVTFTTIFFVKIVTIENLRKLTETYGNLRKTYENLN
jgi:hypothetical protein